MIPYTHKLKTVHRMRQISDLLISCLLDLDRQIKESMLGKVKILSKHFTKMYNELYLKKKFKLM